MSAHDSRCVLNGNAVNLRFIYLLIYLCEIYVELRRVCLICEDAMLETQQIYDSVIESVLYSAGK